MSDDPVRAVVRAAIDRHLARRADAPAPRPAVSAGHPAFTLCVVPAGGDAGGADACLVEPSVRCTHCGFCQSYGH